MAKTLEELLSGGTLAEIIARQTENTKAAAAIFDKKDATADEIKSAVAMDEETEKLQVKRVELEKIEEAKKRYTKRMADLGAPDRPHFSGGQGGAHTGADELGSKPVVQVKSAATLKHITAHTPQDAEALAFRFFHFFNAGVLKNTRSLKWCQEHGIPVTSYSDSLKVAGSMSEDTNEAGGVLVPPEFDMMLIRLLEQYGVFRRNTRVTQMGSDVKNRPRRTGGVTAYWVAAGQTITRSRPTYDNVGLVAKKLAALCAIDSEISEDAAVSTADEIAFEIGYAFALSEDQAGFNGDGTSTYGGIQGVRTKIKGLSGTIADIAGLKIAAGNAYSEILLTDFQAVAGLLPIFADNSNAGWFVHKSFYYNVMQKLELAAGGVTANEISQGDRRPRPLFLGYPVNFSQVLPNVEANSQVCALLGDLSMASTLGDRRRVTLFNDPYSLAADDQTQVRGTERIDINVHDVGNATSVAADKQPGPIVGLITAAS